MAEPITTRSTPLPPFPFEEAIKPLQKQAFITINDDSSAVQRTWAAFSGDKKRLDLGDIFYALAHPSLYSDIPGIRTRLLGFLGYREDDPISFKTIAMGSTQQVALTIIEPENRDASVPPMIFAGGFAHPASLYTPQLVALAQELHTKIVIVDAPGNGGSQSSTTVNQKDFYAALKATITSEVPEGSPYYVSGHSLGSSAAYQLFKEVKDGKSPVGHRELVRAVIINPIPSRLHETTGTGTIARKFMVKGLFSEFAHGGMGLRANSLSLFDNDQHDKADGRALVSREDIPISIPGLISTYGNVDLNDATQYVGHDDRIVIVMSRDDHLMNWNAETFVGRRGYTVIDGDHGACVTGIHITGKCTKTLAATFTGIPDPTLPTLEASEIYAGASGHVRVGIQGSSSKSMTVVPEMMLKIGTLSFGQDLGIYFNTGFLAELGYQFGNTNRGIAMPQVQLTVGAEGLRWPLSIEAGVKSGIDFLKPEGHQMSSHLVASIGTNLSRIFDFTVKTNFDFSGKFQDVTAGLALKLN